MLKVIYYYNTLKPNKSVLVMMSIIMMVAAPAAITITPAATVTIRNNMDRSFAADQHIKEE
jgi:hypothetical protein